MNDYFTLSNDELLGIVKSLISSIKRAQLVNSPDLKDLLSEATRVKSELDIRLSSYRKEVSRDDDSLSDDRISEAKKIRSSKHFSQNDKDTLVAELYGEEGYDFEGNHFEGNHFKR